MGNKIKSLLRILKWKNTMKLSEVLKPEVFKKLNINADFIIDLNDEKQVALLKRMERILEISPSYFMATGLIINRWEEAGWTAIELEGCNECNRSNRKIN